MHRTLKSLLVALGTAMLFSALGVGVVLAEGDGDGDDSSEATEETRQSKREEARTAFAEALGVTVEELEAAFRQVALDRVDDALEAGTITEEQAEALKTAIDSGEWRGKRWGGRAFRHGGFAEGTSLDELATARKQAVLDRIDDALEAGTITEEKAEQWRTAIESGEKPEREKGDRDWRRGFRGRSDKTYGDQDKAATE